MLMLGRMIHPPFIHSVLTDRVHLWPVHEPSLHAHLLCDLRRLPSVRILLTHTLTEMLHSSASDHPCFKMAVVRLSV